jgi:ABC-type nickel/cobalt efflux system permease component RcnA
LALGFGAIHALEPGHGKTFVAAYFVGVKGTVRQALGLGAIVAVTHTIGVLAIGLIVLFGSQYILPERLYPWLSLASGIMVLALGVRLLTARAGGWRAVRWFAFVLRREGNRRHDHEQAHAHGHHLHDAVSGAPPWKSLLALGLADGLTPSPSALVVLLAAVSLDRIGLGLLLIGAFSVGLAAVLTLVSLGLVYARRAVDWVNTRRSLPNAGRGSAWLTSGLGPASGIMNALPIGGAFVLLTVGVVLTVRALSQPELLIF